MKQKSKCCTESGTKKEETCACSCTQNYEAVQRRAYELFEARGGQHGFELEDWLKAEQEVSQKH